MKCPLKGKKTEKSQTQQKGQQTSVDPMFSNIRNRCIHCGGDHAPGPCPIKTHLQATQNAAGYQMYDNGAATSKANANHLPSFSSKSSQPTAANMTPSSPKNLAGAQRHPSCTRGPITPQVSPNTSQQNFYSVLPVHPPNHFVDLQDADITPGMRSTFDALCERYPKVFSKGNEDIGRTQLVTMDIDTGDSPSISSRPYTLALKHHRWVQEEIETLKRAGVITKSMSPWASPIVVVPKKSQPGEPPQKEIMY